MTLHFGEHITIDGYGGSPKRLDERLRVLRCLDEICELLKMTPLCKPQICRAPDNHIKDPGGWSGFVVIAESHVSIHTFPRRRFLSADVYTCRNGLDVDFITGFFKRKFLLKDLEIHALKRGTKYPARNLL
jgi:S-adenosylmethionine decarboxylase